MSSAKKRNGSARRAAPNGRVRAAAPAATDNRPIVLAFSGGLDTSFCVPFLRDRYAAPIVTVTVDTGGMADADRRRIAERAKALGAAEHHLVDGRAAYFDETLRFLIMGNVLRGHVYPLCVGAERTLQARLVAETARKLRARAVAHGSTAAGNDQVRFEVALRTLAPGLEILAPIRDEALSREQEIEYLRARHFDFPFERAAYSINLGLWGCTIGGKETTDTLETIPENAWVLTRAAFTTPRPSALHRLSFERGVPVALDGKRLAPVALIERLNALAAAFGVGRGIHLGDTIFGLKGRVAFEAPAAAVLLAAHREIEKLTLTAKQQRVKDLVAATYGDLVHEALFVEPACRDIEALLLSSQARVSGEVKLRLSMGSFFIEGLSSPHSLRSASKGVYGEAAGEWTAADARGFSRLWALPSMLYRRAQGANA
ncbi:MAG: argininosuccinate synthase [Deltaproteobacteria bacterium]|nr:argininosuccinate synthase [Deltaproteobacteria bacterium]